MEDLVMKALVDALRTIHSPAQMLDYFLRKYPHAQTSPRRWWCLLFEEIRRYFHGQMAAMIPMVAYMNYQQILKSAETLFVAQSRSIIHVLERRITTFYQKEYDPSEQLAYIHTIRKSLLNIASAIMIAKGMQNAGK